MSDSTLRLIAGRYRLVSLLGEGGMGRVWAARDTLLSRDVAVKEMLPLRGLTAEEMDYRCERAFREARAAARLTHPNVVRVIDVVSDNGLPCIVMELVPARSLHQTIHDGGPMAPRRVARIGLDVLAGLRAAHEQGLLHRDVKPANVLLARDGRAVLTDFGLVSIAGEPRLTATGIVLGSPSFMAPEIALDHPVDRACDLWSLGATLYMAVEGSPPYARSTQAATLAALATEPPRPPTRPGVLSDVLEGLLQRDPARRIDASTAERLLRIAADDDAPARTPVAVKKDRKRVVLRAGLIAGLLVVAAVPIGMYVVPRGDGPGTAAAALPPTAKPAAPSTPGSGLLVPAASARPSPALSPTPKRPADATRSKRPSKAATTPRAPGGTGGDSGVSEPDNDSSDLEFRVVSFQALANNRYVAADDGGTSPLIAYPEAIGPWETWDEMDLGNGDIALRAEINNRFVTADGAGVRPLIASETSIGKAETFHLVHNADGTVSLLSRANGKYVTAADGGAKPMINNQSTIGEAEKYVLVVR